MRFGVNYVPSACWWYSWVDWDRDSIAADLRAVAALNMDHIRIHCLWPIFQPNPEHVSPTTLDHLAMLLDIALDAGLAVEIAVLDGWLSGFYFRPAWQKQRNMFTDPFMIHAEKQLLDAIAERVGHHPALLGIDLGNEVNVLTDLGEPLTLDEGDRWQRELFDHCEQLLPGKFHVNGIDHQPWFRDHAFSRGALASLGSASIVHAYTYFTGALKRYGPLGVGSLHIADYMVELSKAYHRDPARQVWVQEFGVSSAWVDAERIPYFAEQTIRNLAACGGLWGWSWWCSHDISPRFADFDPLEYDLGLLTHDSQIKPVGACVRDLVAALKANPPDPKPHSHALVVSEALFADEAALWRLIDRYMALAADGQAPALVLEDRASDTGYLASRGILTVERVGGERD